MRCTLLACLLVAAGCTDQTYRFDFDEDGWEDRQDCDPADPDIHPEANDPVGDDIDQDCDGAEAGGEDPECWSGGCSDCASSLGSAPPAPLALLLLLSGALLFRGRTTRPLTNSERP